MRKVTQPSAGGVRSFEAARIPRRALPASSWSWTIMATGGRTAPQGGGRVGAAGSGGGRPTDGVAGPPGGAGGVFQAAIAAAAIIDAQALQDGGGGGILQDQVADGFFSGDHRVSPCNSRVAGRAAGGDDLSHRGL